MNAHIFFKNYNRTLAWALLAIVLTLSVFFAALLQRRFEDEIAAIQAHLDRHQQWLEFSLRTAVDQVDVLRMASDGQALQDAPPQHHSSPNPSLNPSPWPAPNASGSGFDMDNLADRDSAGNLFGPINPSKQGNMGNQGNKSNWQSLQQNPQWQREIRRALGLNAFWRSQLFHLPSAVQTRYLSQHNFVWAAPWKPAKLQALSSHVQDDPVWLQAQPRSNPDRVVFWGKPFFAGAEAGLAVPVAAPVYEGDALVGVVSIDNSLDYLNRINGNFGYPLGEVYVVNDADQVLAHPRLYANPLHLSNAPGLQQALPAHWSGPLHPWQSTAARSLQWHDGHLLLYRPFISAPWHMVYQVPVWPLLWALLQQQGGGMLAVLGALVALLGVTYGLTRRDFVGPAAQLVAHLGYVSQVSQASQAAGMQPQRAYTAPRVPAAWQPWFDTIEKVFSESRQLAGVQQELRIAAEMQRAILPSTWPVSPHYTLCGVMRSAREVGGDFYDHFALGDMQQGIVVADVSGKGVGAALFGMVSKTQWRAMALRGNSAASQPAHTMTEVNNALADHNEQCMFVTGLYAVLDAAQGQLHIANAGHPPLVRLRRNTSTPAGDWQVSLIGMDSSMALGLVPDAPIASQTLQLQTGDLYVLYTDGVTEAMNPAQEEFGNARLLHALGTALHSLPPDAPLAPLASLAPKLQQALIAAVDEFAQGAEQSDDITCLVLHYHPQETAC